VSDRGNRVIRRIFQGEVRTLAGCPGSNVGWDGKGEEAGFQEPGRIACDPRTGNLLVVDRNSIRLVTLAEEVTTLAGSYYLKVSIPFGLRLTRPTFLPASRTASSGVMAQPSALP
jgi:hypothetical protein